MSSDFQTTVNLPSTNDESINSILVVQAEDSAPIRSVTADSQLPAASLTQLEKKYADLKWKYTECLQDNVLLKSQCDYLNAKIEDLKRAQCEHDNLIDNEYETFENNESILAYVDVDNICISNKIENYLQETDTMFTNSDCLHDSMAFLIKNIWSLIAHKYSEHSLEASQLRKDQILQKLADAKYDIDKQRQISEGELLKMNSLNDDLLKVNANSESIKTKILQQNIEMKSLIEQMEASKSFSVISDSEALKSKSSEINVMKQETKDTVQIGEDPTSISPGSSPSSFFLNRFENKLDKMTTGATTTTSVTTDSKQTPNITSKQPTNEFYMCNFQGDYIAIDKTIEASNEMIKSAHEDALERKVGSDEAFTTLTSDTSSTVSSLFTCVNCNMSVEKTQLHNKTIYRHTTSDCRSRLVCMFCMELFEKSLHVEFEQHVRLHMSLSPEDM